MLTVYNVQGRIAISRNIKEGELIDASELKKGAYFVKIEFNEIKTQSKLLKQ